MILDHNDIVIAEENLDDYEEEDTQGRQKYMNEGGEPEMTFEKDRDRSQDIQQNQ